MTDKMTRDDEVEAYRKGLQWIVDNHYAHPANLVGVAKEALDRSSGSD
jgi:hypothetical protein